MVGEQGTTIMQSCHEFLWAQPGNLTVATLSTLLITLTALYIIRARQLRKRLPPGPRPWPILGNLPQFGDLPHQALRAFAAKYGDLMYIRMGSQPCIVVSDATVAKELFRTNDVVFASQASRLAIEVYSGGKDIVGAPYGPYWRELRKIFATELFSNRNLASHQKSRTEETHYMMKILLEDSKKGMAVNLKSWPYGVASNNMTRMLVNKRCYGDGLSSNEQEREELEQLVSRTFTMLSALVISDFVPWLSFITKLQGWKSKLEDLLDFTHSTADKLIEVEKHRERAKERRQREQKEEDYVPDFIDVLTEASLGNGEPIPDKDFSVMFMDIVNGGTETTSTTVEWAMADLMLHPAVMKQAQDELDMVVGTDRVVEESDIPNLPYLQAITKEAFRMHPALALSLPRESHQATEFLGYKLPAHTQLIINLFAIHRDPSVYTNPDVFNPERFMDHPEVNPTSGFDHYELIPFSAGP